MGTLSGWVHAETKSGDEPRLVVQTGHGDQVTSLAFSPDGRVLVSGSDDKTVKLWDVASGRELRSLGGHADQVLSVAFSPDGKTVASGSWDDTIKLWDVVTGKELWTQQENGWVLSVAFSPDGSTVASATRGNRVSLWNAKTGRALFHMDGHGENVTSVAFSQDGHTLASVSLDGMLILWDALSGQMLSSHRISAGGLKSVTCLRGSRALAVAALDGTIYIRDTQTGKALRVLKGHAKGVHALAANQRDGTLASIGADNTIRQWDATTGEALAVSEANDYKISDFSVKELAATSNVLAFSPDGHALAWGEGRRIAVRIDGQLRKFGGDAEDARLIQYFDNRLEVHTDNLQLAMWQLDMGSVVGRLARDKLPQRKEDQFFALFSNEKIGVSWGIGSDDIEIWNADTGERVASLPVRCASLAAISDDGKIAATVGGCPRVFSVVDGKLSENELPPDTMKSKDITLWDLNTGQAISVLSGHSMGVLSLAFSPDGRFLVSGGEDQRISLWDIKTNRQIKQLRSPDHEHYSAWVSAISFSPDGKTIAAGTRDNFVELWDVASGSLRMRLAGHLSAVHSVAFSPNGKFIVSASEDKSIRYWRASDGAYLASLYSFADGTWAVTDPAGHFEAANLEEIKGLHWVMPDDPLTPVPLEAFMRDYYEPRLLTRILNGETFKPVRALSELNRVQPEVRIIAIAPVAGQPEFVDVTVEARGARRGFRNGGEARSTAAHDLRLFRNGQLVGYRNGRLSLAGQSPYLHSFRVRLPSGSAFKFSAYAFNDDGVKSATAQADYAAPVPVAGRKPRAWIVTVGVNRHDNRAWNLEYAANDAQRIRDALVERLQRQGQYSEVVAVTLISDASGVTLATKANLKAVLDRLAGRPANVSAIPNGNKLRQAMPDDLVLISFSGHGVNEDGHFYLIPSDTGVGQGFGVTPRLLSHAISGEELANWLRDLDGGDIAMIIDACHSAASVGSDFKPGPMGARGLGQLAYEKGMRILAASQASEAARESGLTQQGLLSYALVNDGLEQNKADFQPADGKITLEEWLRFGMRRVPGLAEEVVGGRLENRGAKLVERTGSLGEQRRRALQQPALFDFAKERRDVLMAVETATH